MDGRLLRRSVTLADQLAAVGPGPASAAVAVVGAAGSYNLRDLLKLRDEDDLAAGRRRAAAAVTLASAMAADRQAALSSPSRSSSGAAAATAAVAARTLLDVIRDDHQPTATSSAAGAGAGGDGDLFVRRAVSLPAPRTASPPALTAAAEAAPAPPVEAPQQPRQLPTAVPTEEEQGERVSLMALLEQTERQWSAGVGATAHEQDLELELVDYASAPAQASAAEDEPEPEAGRGAAGGGCCCVCMARAKGAAFIPCGHTFCRACARELLAGRGRCPLCNAAIVDVLDIF